MYMYSIFYFLKQTDKGQVGNLTTSLKEKIEKHPYLVSKNLGNSNLFLIEKCFFDKVQWPS